MEVLVFDKASQEELQGLYFFLSFGKQYDVEISICNKVIEVRRSQSRKILPDLIIAATAIVNNHILLTRNTSDFKNIPGLQVENPWDWK
jgi:predicted nucleic acid-binding protein